jgi:hypothetical protein
MMTFVNTATNFCIPYDYDDNELLKEDFVMKVAVFLVNKRL